MELEITAIKKEKRLNTQDFVHVFRPRQLGTKERSFTNWKSISVALKWRTCFKRMEMSFDICYMLSRK